MTEFAAAGINKVYYGERINDRCKVYITTRQNTEAGPLLGTVELPFIGRHSPDGFEWGYGGSGPAELALAILTDLLGKKPPHLMYHSFKIAIIAHLDRYQWYITDHAVTSWVKDFEAREAAAGRAIHDGK